MSRIRKTKVMPPCSVDGCSRLEYALGLCHGHYERIRRTGELGSAEIRGYDVRVQYFEDHVMEPSVGCREWEWCTSRSGYPTVGTGRSKFETHSETCRRWHGPRPEGMEAAHSCGNRKCWAGEHLSWKTRPENANDKWAHGTMKIGERHHNVKLTAVRVNLIRHWAAAGIRQADLARQFGVNPGTIYSIVHLKLWRWLPSERTIKRRSQKEPRA